MAKTDKQLTDKQLLEARVVSTNDFKSLSPSQQDDVIRVCRLDSIRDEVRDGVVMGYMQDLAHYNRMNRCESTYGLLKEKYTTDWYYCKTLNSFYRLHNGHLMYCVATEMPGGCVAMFPEDQGEVELENIDEDVAMAGRAIRDLLVNFVDRGLDI